jgi:uncharacterized damage-inducible protein DinB
MSEVFLDLYRHNLWANQRLLDACQSVPDETLHSTAAGTYGTSVTRSSTSSQPKAAISQR